MRHQILHWNCILLFSIFVHSGQLNDPVSLDPPVKIHKDQNAPEGLFIYYPKSKSGKSYTVFLNKKKVGRLEPGWRIECGLLPEGPLAVTIIDGNNYREPLTQDKNSRTISVKKDKGYYFRVNGTGGLEYVFNPAKGHAEFSDAGEFVSSPYSYLEVPGASIATSDTMKE